jgi:pimeloyl-ACP methyl ester carboxylesterase
MKMHPMEPASPTARTGRRILPAAASSGWAASSPTWRAPRRRRWRTLRAARGAPVPLRLFGPRRLGRRIPQRHDYGLARPVAPHVHRKAPGRRIVVGSSMGGWLALLLYRELRIANPRAADRIAGLVLLAPAADMTADLMWDVFPEVRDELAAHRRLAAPLALWRALCHHPPADRGRRQAPDAEGRAGRRSCPVRILQGDVDPGRAASHAVKLFGALRGSGCDAHPRQGRRSPALDTRANLTLLRETVLRLAERADGIRI